MNKKYLAFLFLFTIGLTLLTPCYNTIADGGGLFPEGWKEDVEKKAGGAETWSESSNMGTVAKAIFGGLIAGVAMILFILTQGFADLSYSLLTWVTSEGFINVQFTTNDFVADGWGIVRDLTNILIVLGLVVIALATILRIQSYQMKKTLPLLLIIALLVNFSPMLCGIVIDASNIIMEHFLKAGLYSIQSYITQLGSAFSAITSEISNPSGVLAKGLLLVGSSLFAGIIFLLYAVLFLFRYVALWILVILSPLAFFCYIFPGTKKIWNQWLSQFIQWSFIGIPAAFTIYLSNKMTILMLDNELIGEMSSMGKIMGYIVPVAFLAAGFFMSLQTGAMGAKAVITNSKKLALATTRLTATTAEKATRRPRKWTGEKLATKPSKIEGEERASRGGLLGYAGRGLLANISRHEREESKKAEEKAEKKSFEEIDVLLHSPNATKRVQALKSVIEGGNIDKIGKVTGFSKQDKEKIMRDTLKYFPSLFSDFAESEVKIAEKIVGKTGKNINDNIAKKAGVFMSEKDIEKYKTVSQKLVSTAKDKDISKWSKETMNTALESESFHKALKGSKISAMAKQFGDDFFESFKDNVANEEWYKKEAPAAHKYISGSAGQGLGVGFGPENREKPGSATSAPEESAPEKTEEKKDTRWRGKIQYESIDGSKSDNKEKRKEDDSSIV